MTGTPRRTRRVTALSLLVPLAVGPLLAVAPGGASAAGTVATTGAPVTQMRTVSRVHLDGGKDVVVDSRRVSVTVSATTGLRDRQTVLVTWSGAHPTGFQVADANSGEAAQQEYPMVLLQCRGVATSTAPAAQQVRPETCWTQTAEERFTYDLNSDFDPWRVDRYANPQQRQRMVGRPSPVPADCKVVDTQATQHWLHFVAASGMDFPGGNGGCGGLPPEAAAVDSNLAQPGNGTYGFTGKDGTGSARFTPWTTETNLSLGCSDKVPCALVAVPIEGISCDVAAAALPPADRPAAGDEADQAKADCEARSGTSTSAPAVSGGLWWSASNWRNRMVFPLSFRPLPVECGLNSGRSGVDVYGSELMIQATQSWGSALCQDKGATPLRHVQTGETQARNLITTGSSNAAFTTDGDPSGYGGRPVVTAPAALSGFAIGFNVDDASGHPTESLRLNGRLLAKLLTESYPSNVSIRNGYPKSGSGVNPLADNPLDISRDPEFQALNPTVGQTANGTSAAMLDFLSSDSDVTRALTSYLNSDPEARGWLDGKADPWGMVVNPAYRGIVLPVDSWPLLDTAEFPDFYKNIPCLSYSPVPYLPLVGAPSQRLSLITIALAFAIAPSNTSCYVFQPNDPNGSKLVPLGREVVGSRFLLGVTSVADAARFNLSVASLQTRNTRTDVVAPFHDASGRTFVAPTPAGLRAAAALLTPDSSQGTWTLPYGKLVGPAGSASAYPGTMLVSTVVPTTGLPKSEAAAYAATLRYIAGPGQVSGGNLGQLPAGYLPVTAANGLGAEHAYAVAAAAAVDAQRAGTLPLTPSSATGGTSTEPAAGSPGATAGSGPAAVGGAAGPSSPSAQSGTSTSGTTGGHGGTPGRTPAPAPQSIVTAATVAPGSGALGMALPALLGTVVLAGLGGLLLTPAARGHRAP